MAIESRQVGVIEALDALRESASHDDARISSFDEEVERAVAAGASWDAIVAAIGTERVGAWEQLGQDVCAAMLRNASSADAPSEAEAMELAIAETKAVRKEHARARSLPSRPDSQAA